MPTFQEGKQAIIDKFNKDYVLKSLIPSAICLILMFLFHNPIAGYVFFILSFTAFDCLGFGNLAKINDLNKKEDVDSSMSYRIIQLMFEVVCIGLVWQTCGIVSAISCLIVHFFTVCDKLFYITQKIPDYEGQYTWLNSWSIFLIINSFGDVLSNLIGKIIFKVFKITVNLNLGFLNLGIKPFTKQFNIASIIGFVIGLGLIIFF